MIGMKNKFVLVIGCYLVLALSPLIMLSQKPGLSNIPHYNLQMWIFLELYALIAGLIGLGIIMVALADGEEEPVQKKRKHNGTNPRSGNGTNKQLKKKERKLHVKHSEKPQKPRKPRKPAAKKEGAVETPAEWKERDFE